MKTNSKMITSNILLVLTSLIWGVAFVAQSTAMEYVEPFTFNAMRFFLGAVTLIPFILISKNKSTVVYDKKQTIVGGIVCGVILAMASSLQQLGISFDGTTAGKAGFITSLYIIIVPLLGIFMKKKVSLKVCIGVALATIGMYLLCIKENFSLTQGDFYVLLCAFCFSFHILVIDFFSPKVDGVFMSFIQFLVCSVICGTMMFIFESPNVNSILGAYIPILYAGVMSCGCAYTLQIIAQKNTTPTMASLLMSLESVFSVIAGFLILGEIMNLKEVLGCILMLISIILAQI